MHSRSTLIFLLIWVTFIWASTFGHMLISGIGAVEIASTISTFLVFICYCVCGLLVPPSAMPHFWGWVYRANPLTYLATGFLSTALAKAPMHCADNEFLTGTANLPKQISSLQISGLITRSDGWPLECCGRMLGSTSSWRFSSIGFSVCRRGTSARGRTTHCVCMWECMSECQLLPRSELGELH